MKDQEVKTFRVFPAGEGQGGVDCLSPYKYSLILWSGKNMDKLYIQTISLSFLKLIPSKPVSLAKRYKSYLTSFTQNVEMTKIAMLSSQVEV